MTLEKKFYKYLMDNFDTENNYRSGTLKKRASDLALIVYEHKDEYQVVINQQLEQENAELKNQLDNYQKIKEEDTKILWHAIDTFKCKAEHYERIAQVAVNEMEDLKSKEVSK